MPRRGSGHLKSPNTAMSLKKGTRVLITGGQGFIGSHIAARLSQMEVAFIRITDISVTSLHSRVQAYHEFIPGNLCDEAFCRQVVQGIDIVIHCAAIMGGMGCIREENDFIIYKENHTMTMNLLEACVEASVKTFFYASSACVYPKTLQTDSTADVSLREDDIIFPPDPQGLYGLEKLHSEGLLYNLPSTMNIHIARFHNVFGPNGAWRNGREKAPAAMLRKAFAMKFLSDLTFSFEIWGNGDQRRSFLYIDDAVDAVVRMLQSEKTGPFNIGSDKSVSIKELADIALRHAGLNPDAMRFKFDEAKPVGVASRNSNNDKVSRELGWTPKTSLEEAMRRTGIWIEEQMRCVLESCESEEQKRSSLTKWMSSDTVDLALDKSIIFAVLLPVTSRGAGIERCLSNLRRLAHSLKETTWRDTHSVGDTRFRVRVYLALDHDDEELYAEGRYNSACDALKDEGVLDVFTLARDSTKGHVCSLWRDCAKKAWEDGCHYMVLLGDDIVLHDEGWMRKAHNQFKQFSEEYAVPSGFGCIAFTDLSFPGMPTFPIIHRTHLDIFEGEVVPEVFVNQDGDPYLFQLYRRWGCSVMFPSRISNTIGGKDLARYQKIHVDWTFNTLDEGVCKIEDWLRASSCNIQRKLMLDVVVPSYRVSTPILDRILNLKASETCSTMFIIIVDDPDSPHIHELMNKYGHRWDVRIRVNEKNMGASESRNRGMRESSADWIHFLDDDIVPDPDLLVRAEESIRAHPNAAGFIGKCLFPPTDTIFTTAVHLAGVLYFWDIATKIPDDLPWGVTANLIVPRRNDGISFDPIFPKTGGGEDIDYCRKKREYSLSLLGGEGFRAAPEVTVTHPWWNGGKRSYWRFYMWAVGDGALVKLYPEHCYIQWMPNSSEMLLLCVLLTLGVMPLARIGDHKILDVLALSFKALLAIILGNVLHDSYRILWCNKERYVELKTSVNGVHYLLAVIEGCFLRMFSEMGRLMGMIQRKEYSVIMERKRFDWFTGRWGTAPMKEELGNGRERVLIILVLLFGAVRAF